MSYIIAIIGARSGSKGVPDKNIRSLAGHPLLAYSIKAAQKAGNIDRVIVSTDSPKYAEIANQYGAEVTHRPSDISGDASTDFEFILNALMCLEADHAVPDLLVHLRPTTPLREPAVIAEAIQEFRSMISATAMRSVHPMPESAYKCLQIKSGQLLTLDGDAELDPINDPRQTFPATFHANGYVDILRTSLIKECGLLHGNRVSAFVTPRITEVDTLDDFHMLEMEVSPPYVKRLFA